MRAVAYARKVSVIPRYSNVSLKEQNDRIRDYAAEKGWKVIGFYDDRSEDINADTGFQKLESDGKNRQFDVVIIDSIYRCGKNVSYARELLQNVFYPAGINFVVIEDNIYSEEMTQSEVEDYFYRARQRANILYGKDIELIEKTDKGVISPDKECYGYLLSADHKEFVIDEEAASVIRLIFQMFDEGKRLYEVVRYLNDNKIDVPAAHIHKVCIEKPGCKSNVWQKGMVMRIRKNQIYKGCTKNIGYMNLSYPAIVSSDVFDRVMDKFSAKASDKSAKRSEYFDNAFYRKVFFEDSDERLRCGINPADGKYYFYKNKSENALVSYLETESAVRNTLIAEKKKCLAVKTIFGTEKCDFYKNSLISEYADAAKDLCVRIDELIKKKIHINKTSCGNKDSGNDESCIENSDVENVSKLKSDIEQELAELESEISEIMNIVDDIEKMFSVKNPWIKKYCTFNSEADFTIKNLKPFINRIDVSKNGDVKISLYEDGKECFPEGWLISGDTEGDSDGEKE